MAQTFFPEGDVAQSTDPPIRSLIKIVDLLQGGGGGGGGSGSTISGAFANPNGNVTPADPTKGALYYQAGGSGTLWEWQVGSQTWT
jgi:hypothetical protein